MYTKDDVVPVLRALVEEFGPEYKYQEVRDEEGYSGGCLYVHDRTTDPKPGCIVGHVYTRLTGEFVPDDYEDSSVEALVNDGVLDVDAETAVILERMQLRQDRGVSWGEALDKIDEPTTVYPGKEI